MADEPAAITPDLLPQLATDVGMVDATVEVEVGGQVCVAHGIAIIGALL